MASAFEGGDVRADAGADAERRKAVVARVEGHAITVAAVEDRLALVPTFQRKQFGRTEAEIRKGFFERVVLSDELVVAGARAQGLDKRTPASMRIARALANAELRHMRRNATTAE